MQHVPGFGSRSTGQVLCRADGRILANGIFYIYEYKFVYLKLIFCSGNSARVVGTAWNPQCMSTSINMILDIL